MIEISKWYKLFGTFDKILFWIKHNVRNYPDFTPKHPWRITLTLIACVPWLRLAIVLKMQPAESVIFFFKQKSNHLELFASSGGQATL